VTIYWWGGVLLSSIIITFQLHWKDISFRRNSLLRTWVL
jgi:hypothetical protein